MKNQEGMALLLAVILSLLLSVLGLGLTMASMTEFRASQEFENHERALLIADAGFQMARNRLRGADLSDLLGSSVTLARYVDVADPLPGTYAYRNPLPPLEARNIDFESPPLAIGTRLVKGFLSAPEGDRLGSGRFFARVTDNLDEPGAADLDQDSDATVYLRVLGVSPVGSSDVSSYGGRIKNSVAIVEGLLRRDLSFDINSPFTVYGPDVNPSKNKFFAGNSFLVDGHDHSHLTPAQVRQGSHNHSGQTASQAAIGMIYDGAGGGDATTAVQSVYQGLSSQQYDNLVGAAGPYGLEPSLRDDTELIRNSANPDATNIFDPEFIAGFIQRVASVADLTYPGGTSLSGSGIKLGTDDAPKITYVNGDLKVSGNGSGAGILVVTGKLDYNGAFHYNGVILVVGQGEVELGGANKSIVGGLYVAKLVEEADGRHSFGTPSFTLSGNSNFYFRSASVRMGLSLLPMKTLLWREITPEIEPME